MGFFRNIEPFDDFREAFNPSRYHPAPEDWFIVISDIKGSTTAIQNNKYKEVNIVGASTIISVLNAIKHIEVPFVFGGDGASFVIPPSAVKPVASAIQGTREMAADIFGMTLRAGIVPVSEVRFAGQKTNIAKYKLSEKIMIAMFDGGGLAYAEDLIKDPEKEDQYDIRNRVESFSPTADFSGLECRWNPVGATRGEMLTLMVRAMGADSAGIYNDLFAKVQDIYGEKENYRPTKQESLSLAFQPKYLKQEHGIQTHTGNIIQRCLYALKMGFETVMGSMLLYFDISIADVEGRKYVNDLILNTDFQKFDETLRMVMDSHPKQSSELIEYLDTQYRQGKLFYGAHTAKEALITCLIFDRHEKHLHFIDGASGGYALAAKNMKEQEKLLKPNP